MFATPRGLENGAEPQRRLQAALLVFLAFLCLTGGASSPLRLAVLAAPLLVFCPPLRVVIVVALCVCLPSALEMALYGNWTGPIAYRLHTLAAFVVAALAFGCGQQIFRDAHLRRVMRAAIPWFAVSMMAQALIQRFDLLPPDYQYLSGNQQSAVITGMMPFAFARDLPARDRLISIGAMMLALVATGSRWGALIGFLVVFMLAARLTQTRLRWLLAALATYSVALSAALLGYTELSKGDLIMRMLPLAVRRPLTGIGPGGVEILQFEYLVRDSWVLRQTHGESLVIDWPALMGVPLAVLAVFCILFLAFWRVGQSPKSGQSNLRIASAVSLVGLLLHDLMDFSWTSGAAACVVALNLGILAPPIRAAARGGWRPAMVSLSLVGLLAQASLLDPLKLEALNRLEEVPARFGQRSFRYWVNKGLNAPDEQARLVAYSKALHHAPGVPETWFRLGTTLLASGRLSQALEVFRSGLKVAPANASYLFFGQLAPLPREQAISVFGGHVRGRQFLAEQWVKQGREALSDLEKLVTQHDDPLLDAFLLRALLRKEAPNSQAVPLLWKQLKNGRFKGRQGWRALTEIESRVSGAKSGELLVRLVQMSPAHCAQLGWIPEASRLKLLPFIEELDERCWSKLIGKPKALGTLRMLRVESELR